jgi:DNA-binding transcriptional ArsR family regulator
MVYSESSSLFSTALNGTFGALADPTRRAILLDLSRGERTIGELAALFDMTLPGVSKHVRVLERAGLTDVRRVGRVRRCRLVGAPLRAADAWIAHYRAFWEQQLDQFAAYLDTNPEESSACPAPTSPKRPTSSSSVAPSTRPSKERTVSGQTRKR